MGTSCRAGRQVGDPYLPPVAATLINSYVVGRGRVRYNGNSISETHKGGIPYEKMDGNAHLPDFGAHRML